MSQTDDAVRYLTGLYGPRAEQLARGMAEIGDALKAQLDGLTLDPTPDQCLAVASNLEGARRAVLRLREGLQREGAA